jgi:hypothetical protein
MPNLDTIELQGYVAARSALTFPPDGGGRIAFDVSEDQCDAAYLVKKHMRKKLLHITIEVEPGQPEDTSKDFDPEG